MTPELNTPPAANNTPTCLPKDLNEHIDIQINKALAPFISKLSTLIKEHEQLSAENKFVRDINNKLRQTTTNYDKLRQTTTNDDKLRQTKLLNR